LLGNQLLLLVIILITAFWQVAPIKLMALKFKTWGWQGNQMRYVFILLALIAILLFRIEAIPIVILLYLIISLAQTAIKTDS